MLSFPLQTVLRQRFLLGGLALLVACCLGCGGSSGPSRYKVSGKVTFKGQPVPKGEITFAPDTAAGNTGPGSSTRIIDGVFETAPGMGVVGGPYVIAISGFDGVPDGDNSDGKLLFPRNERKVDLPKSDSTQDFAIQ